MAPIKVKSNGGFEINNDSLSIKLNSNKTNILRLSTAGLMGKFNVLTKNLKAGGYKFTDLDMTYPPIDNSQGTCWGQVKLFAAEENLLSWGINRNVASRGSVSVFGTKSNSDIKFVRNNQEYILFKQN